MAIFAFSLSLSPTLSSITLTRAVQARGRVARRDRDREILWSAPEIEYKNTCTHLTARYIEDDRAHNSDKC